MRKALFILAVAGLVLGGLAATPGVAAAHGDKPDSAKWGKSSTGSSSSDTMGTTSTTTSPGSSTGSSANDNTATTATTTAPGTTDTPTENPPPTGPGSEDDIK